jgi:hypothetical protein
MRLATAEPAQRRAGNELPPYEKPSFPLNPAAQRALEQLRRAHDLRNLENGLSEAQGALANTAGEINERLYQKELAAKKRRIDREQSSSADAEGEDKIERSLQQFRDKVERMTQRMDESMRKMIDGRHSTHSIQGSLGATSRDARTNAATQASTQQARTQQYEDFQPTDPAAGTQDQPTPIDSFRSKMEDAKTRYQSFSLNARYANDNDYRGFRRVVHDAKHPDGDVELAHHSEWFEEGGTAAPGMTGCGRANDEDEDDDIAISRATISTKCPLTLQEYVSPLSSTKCPHSFEAEAILTMIRRSATREGGNQVVQCPVSGCSQMIGEADLHTDAVLIQKIKRLRRARELEQEEADEDEDGEGGGGPTVIDDDADDVDDIIEGRSTQVKGEPCTQRGPSRPQSTAHESRTTPMDIDDDETDDE